MQLQQTALMDSDSIRFTREMNPVEHHFAPDVYIRDITMEPGQWLIGAEHKTEHFNIVMTGRADVLMDFDSGEWQEVKAPCVFVSKPGVKKVLIIHERMRWLTVHKVDGLKTLADVDDLEESLTDEVPKRVQNEALVQNELRELAAELDSRRKLA